MPSGQICLWWETEGKREGLFNWWWAGEKQRQKKMRGSTEWEKKSMRSSERNDDIGVEAVWKKQQILWVDRKAERKTDEEKKVTSKVLKEDLVIYVKSGKRQEGLNKKDGGWEVSTCSYLLQTCNKNQRCHRILVLLPLDATVCGKTYERVTMISTQSAEMKLENRWAVCSQSFRNTPFLLPASTVYIYYR